MTFPFSIRFDGFKVQFITEVFNNQLSAITRMIRANYFAVLTHGRINHQNHVFSEALMLTTQIPPEKDGKRLVNALSAMFPELGTPALFRALRHRDIRINGRRVRQDVTVRSGDQIEIYMPDSPTAQNRPGQAADHGFKRSLSDSGSAYRVIFENDQLLLIDKPAGLSVHGDRDGEDEGTLIDQLKKDYRDQRLTLCHRLDRNTGGLMMVARTPAIEAMVREAMAQHLIIKRYRCLVRGVPTAGVPVQSSDRSNFYEISAHLEKDSRNSTVYIHDKPQRNDHPITTRYRIIQAFTGIGENSESVSELEVELVTGRTHQIRAHLAHIGHPLLGDGKYGKNQFNRLFSGKEGQVRRQQLCAVSLIFSHQLKGPLAGLAGRTFSVPAVYDVDLTRPPFNA